MTRTVWTAVIPLLVASAFTGQTVSSKSTPSRPANTWSLKVDKDVKPEAVADLHNPTSVTVCSDGGNPILLSIDGIRWHPLSILDQCAAVPAVRFVKMRASMNDKSEAEVYATY